MGTADEPIDDSGLQYLRECPVDANDRAGSQPVFGELSHPGADVCGPDRPEWHPSEDGEDLVSQMSLDLLLGAGPHVRGPRQVLVCVIPELQLGACRVGPLASLLGILDRVEERLRLSSRDRKSVV